MVDGHGSPTPGRELAAPGRTGERWRCWTACALSRREAHAARTRQIAHPDARDRGPTIYGGPMVEAVSERGAYSLRLTAGTSTWTARLPVSAGLRAAAHGRTRRRAASCELAVDEARFMLALDDDTSEFHRRYARDPLLGPTCNGCAGCGRGARRR